MSVVILDDRVDRLADAVEMVARARRIAPAERARGHGAVRGRMGFAATGPLALARRRMSAILVVDEHRRLERRSDTELAEPPAVDAVERHAHHIVVKDHDGYPVVEVSMGTGVLAAVVAPLVAAAGTVAALANDWSVEIE